MARILIGIHAHAEPRRLLETLAALRAHTPQPHDLLLLPDGPDGPTRAVLEDLTDLPQSSTPNPQGPPACFNRLIAQAADVYVLLESGALVGPGWLGRLLAALEADPRNGLAGPSTNQAWNEQAAFPRARGEQAAVRAAAEAASARFGAQTRTLAPLHSLADFCYAVRREVVQAIGAADEAYGLGPCWEMDYNIRAARAGWQGVWACGAYVYRAPVTARRQQTERRLFEASRRRYQDKFCALRLRRARGDYEPHCRGEACEHFAPRALVEPYLALPAPRPALPPPCRALTRPGPALPPVAPQPVNDRPLVTCIMPTFNRRAFVPRAIRCFLRQDYPHKELVIIDDGADAVADLVPQDERIRYVRLEGRLTIGAKRNRACALARGAIIAHWDDDDWHAPHRLSYQVEALLHEKAAVCGLNQLLFYDPARGQAWRYAYPPGQRFWLAGSSLCYTRVFWAGRRFAEVNVGEDARFVWAGHGARLISLPDPTFHVGMIHPHNVSPKRTGSAYWSRLEVEEIRRVMGPDFEWPPVACAGEAQPLVSCIMPTANRRPFVRLALNAYMTQDYDNKELLVVDDGDDPIADLVAQVPGARCLRPRQRLTLGAKRNLALREARGEIIAQWDDDDWYAPERLRYQLEPLLAGQADLTGLESTYVLDLTSGRCWTMRPSLHQRMFVGNVHGGTLVFRRRLLEDGLKYPEVNLAEDAGLLRQALQRGGRLGRLPNPGVFIYMRHGRNAWRFQAGQFLEAAGWVPIAPPGAFLAEALSSYQAASQAL